MWVLKLIRQGLVFGAELLIDDVKRKIKRRKADKVLKMYLKSRAKKL